MIHNLKPYAVMKDSGVPWLGEVPEHWEVHRLKYLLRERDSRSSSGKEQLLRVSQYTGVTQRIRSDGLDEPDTRAESLVGYKSVKPDELVVNIMLAWNGSMGVSKFHGIASPAYCVYRFGDSARPWFFHHLLRSPAYKARIKAVSTGVVESRLRLYTDDLYRLEALVPPLPEQAAIVRFLDYYDRKIWRYIRAKQKLIKLLEEQKKAIVHHSVTCGLNPRVRLKPSGVEWLGNVPEHWNVVPIKRVFVSMDYGISESSTDTGTIPLLTMGNIKDGEVTIPKSGGVASVDGKLLLEKGDLLFNRTNSSELVGKVGLYQVADSNVTFASYLVRMRPRPEHEPEYLNMVLNDVSILSIVRREAIPSLHQSNLNPTRYGRLQISLPPFEEQREILQSVKEQTGDLSRAIAGTSSEISLLHEYRTRLIADVVTGKLDVREAAARLPEEKERLELIDEAAAMSDEEEQTETVEDSEE